MANTPYKLVVDQTRQHCDIVKTGNGAEGQPIEGAYCDILVGDMLAMPWYMVPFDKDGRCTAPRTREDLLADVTSNHYTDIFLFSHGWNNDWQDAVASYENFICNYIKLDRHNLTYGRDFRPVLVGIYWPSAVLILPWEEQPEMATLHGLAPSELAILTQVLPSADVQRVRELASKASIDREEATELAGLLAPLYRQKMPDLPGSGKAPTPEQLVQSWTKATQLRQPSDDGQGGLIQDDEGEQAGAPATTSEPETAGILKLLDPRAIVRAATVFLMKDRAGTVGAHGVADLLSGLLGAATQARVHLVGHSFGCKVLLSALCYPERLPRKVNSVLLLEPAISYLAFATAEATGTGKPGGYRAALERVEQPILTTFSSEDVPLHDLFHWAVIRSSDLAEERIAGGGAPNRYAALGGYGPGGCGADCAEVSIKATGERYDLTRSPQGVPKIVALNGKGAIHGHSDISNPYTWWALLNQVVG
jgi:pimeloyl-ACP methyl ester carboxylesterase